MLLIALIARESGAGTRAVKSDASIQLKPSERFRTLKMQMQMPVVALVVVGSLLLTDLERAPAHAVAALVIKVVAEQDLLPEGEIFGIIAGLLGFLLVESCARVFTLVRFYRRDEAMVDTAA